MGQDREKKDKHTGEFMRHRILVVHPRWWRRPKRGTPAKPGRGTSRQSPPFSLRSVYRSNVAMVLQVTQFAELAKQPNRPIGRLGSRTPARRPSAGDRLLQIPVLPGGAVARLHDQLQVSADLTSAIETETGG